MENHEVLYRKYRPQNFNDVVGQENAVALISNAVTSGKPAHAYLFIGSRGLGKTTLARIFASELGVNKSDMYEIDAASNNSVDDIRDIGNAVRALPMESKYKVYIVDEVHMLSKSAFNALLKTLEEPPKHVIFILATTEFDKIPETVKSRCQIVHFNKPTVDVLSSYIKKISAYEDIDITDEALTTLAYLADGSYRDACVRLEEAILSNAGKQITQESLTIYSGVPHKNLIANIVLILAGNRSITQETIGMLKNIKNINYEMTLGLVLDKLRTLLMLRHAMVDVQSLQDNYGKDDIDFFTQVLKDKTIAINSGTIIKVIDAINLTKISPIPGLPLELLILGE